MDLQEAAVPANSEESAQALAKIFTTIATSPLVTMASVHGSVLAGGAGLMTVCDLVVADSETRFGYPEVRRGLAAALVTVFLRRQVGDRAVRELLLTAEPIGAQRALDIGLITRMAPAGTLAAATAEMIGQVMLGGPHALGLIKRFLEELSPSDLAADIRRALVLHSEVRKSEEAREGIRAFLERRPPNFSRS
jgi:methylglutaconyl-CoA hydratase